MDKKIQRPNNVHSSSITKRNAIPIKIIAFYKDSEQSYFRVHMIIWF